MEWPEEFNQMGCLHLVVLLPAFAWRPSNEHFIGQFVVGDLFGFTVEHQFGIQLLGHNSQGENLA